MLSVLSEIASESVAKRERSRASTLGSAPQIVHGASFGRAGWEGARSAPRARSRGLPVEKSSETVVFGL